MIVNEIIEEIGADGDLTEWKMQSEESTTGRSISGSPIVAQVGHVAADDQGGADGGPKPVAIMAAPAILAPPLMVSKVSPLLIPW